MFGAFDTGRGCVRPSALNPNSATSKLTRRVSGMAGPKSIVAGKRFAKHIGTNLSHMPRTTASQIAYRDFGG